MKSYRKELWFNVPSRRGFVNITPEVDVALDEARQDDGAGNVEAPRAGGRGQTSAHGRDAAVLDQQVGCGKDGGGGVEREERAACEEERRHRSQRFRRRHRGC